MVEYITMMSFKTKPRRAIAGMIVLAAIISAAIIEYPFASSWMYAQHVSSVAQTTASWPSYGVAAGGSLPDLSPSQLDAYMANLQNLGAGWVRFDFDWSLIQPDSANSYDWSAYDAIVAAANRHNLHIIGILDFTPGWAQGNACNSAKQCEPASPATYARFAAAAASRYSSKGVRVWEIWNEANTQTFWQPTPSITAYSALLRAAYPAIHSAESNAIVLSASTAPAATNGTDISPADWLSGLYKQGDKPFFDAVGDHPYTFPQTPESTSDQAWSQMANGSNSLRSIMVRNGDAAKKIWITEFGAPTGGPGPAADIDGSGIAEGAWHVTPALQAEIFQQAFTLYKSYNWVGPILIYSYQDAGSDDSTNENFFGIVSYDGTQKPAYAVVHQAFTSN